MQESEFEHGSIVDLEATPDKSEKTNTMQKRRKIGLPLTILKGVQEKWSLVKIGCEKTNLFFVPFLIKLKIIILKALDMKLTDGV